MVVNNSVQLTKEEADFVEDLINKNKRTINNVLRVSLKGGFLHLCEDCVSEMYLLICQNVKELKTHPSPEGWVVVATKNIAKQLKKEEMRRINKELPSNDNHTGGEDVFEEAFYNIMCEDNTVKKIIETFTPREKEVYQLVYVRGVGYNEVAEMLGISGSTIRNINKNLKDKVQQYIKDNLR